MTPNTEQSILARAVFWTLLSGLTASFLLLLSGWAMLAVRPQALPPSGEHQSATVVPSLAVRATKGDGAALLELGLVILMLTPVARVLALAIGWLVHRDWTFGLIACCVLALLALSLLLGTG
jgi:uncharacterized membrane protein